MSDTTDTSRRRVLKLAAATGATATTVGALGGTAAAQPDTGGSLTQDATAQLTDADTGRRIGRFTGDLSIEEFGLQDGEVVTNGVLDGTVQQQGTTQQVSQSFEEVTTSLSSNGGCTILMLDLGPLDLEVLGLRVQLNRIDLDITGETGSGNLLGNLLCAVADLGSGDLSLLSGVVQDLLDVVNRLLGSLSS